MQIEFKTSYPEPDAMKLAETTDLSPNQATELLKKHKGDVDAARKEAKNFKAES